MDLTDQLNCVITQCIQVSPMMKIIKVKPDGWKFPEFEAGQFVALGLPPDYPRCIESEDDFEHPKQNRLIRRAYSIASSSNEDTIEFYIRLVHSGQLTPRLFELKIGDRVWMGKKAVGIFTIDKLDTDRNIILIATGTGLAPYMSMLRSNALKRRGKIIIVHGARNSCDLGYSSELKLLASMFTNFKYHPSITRPGNEPAEWGGDTRYIGEIWKSGLVDELLGFKPKPSDTDIFLCGNPNMISDMKELVYPIGYKDHKKKSPGQLHAEEYY